MAEVRHNDVEGQYLADVVDPTVLKEELKRFYLTPEEFRAGPQSIRALADRMGVDEAHLSRLLATDGSIANEVMSVVAMAGLQHVPQLLQNLYEASCDGSVRATEVYLEWIRKVLQNEELLKHGGLGGNVSVQVMVQNVESAAERMQAFVAAVPEGEAAAAQALQDGTLADERRKLLNRAEVAVQDAEAVPVDPETLPMPLRSLESEAEETTDFGP